MKTLHPPITDLLPRELLGRLQADCATLLGATTVTFRADGGTLTDLFTVSPYCRQVASTPSGQSYCVQSRRDLAMEATQTAKPQQALCHAGVPMVAIPLLLAGEAVAATVVSLQPSPQNPDAAFETARSIGIEPRTLIATARNAAPLPPERLKAAVRLVEDLHRLYGLQLAAALQTDQVKRQMEQSARRMKALYNATCAISSTLTLDQTVRILVEQMALTAGLDRCIIALRDLNGNNLRPAGAYGLAPKEYERFHATEMLDLGIRPEWWDRLKQGRIVMLPLGWMRKVPAGDLLTAREDRRAILAPVSSGGTLWAVAYLDGARDADALAQQEVDVVLAIAGQAGIAIAHISRYEQEQRVARTLQESLLSPLPSQIGDYTLGSLYLPALAEAQVGGDFYDLVQVDEDHFALLIGDVSGKGVEAAVHTGMMKYMARALIIEDPMPTTLVSRLNNAIVAQDVLDSNFITFFYALVNRRENRILYTNAGHEPPLLYHAYLNESRELPPTGPAIGLLGDFPYPQEERPFAEGDSLVTYTDGAVEARNPEGDFYGMDGLRKLLSRSVALDGPGIVDALHNDLRKFTGGGLQDDLALIALKRPGAKPRGLRSQVAGLRSQVAGNKAENGAT